MISKDLWNPSITCVMCFKPKHINNMNFNTDQQDEIIIQMKTIAISLITDQASNSPE